jgi:hypothetical protein
MNLRRLVYVQAVGDAVIPVVAFLFFEWGLYFILLYYFLDLIISEISTHFKIKKVLRFRKGHSYYKPALKRGTLFSLLLLIAFIVLCHVALGRYATPINFMKEFMDFLNYMELGIPLPQWVLLIPILLLANYQQYQMIFIRMEQFRFMLPNQLMETKLRQNIILFAVALVTIPIIALLQPNELILILMIIIGKFIYDIRYRTP